MRRVLAERHIHLILQLREVGPRWIERSDKTPHVRLHDLTLEWAELKGVTEGRLVSEGIGEPPTGVALTPGQIQSEPPHLTEQHRRSPSLEGLYPFRIEEGRPPEQLSRTLGLAVENLGREVVVRLRAGRVGSVRKAGTHVLLLRRHRSRPPEQHAEEGRNQEGFRS